MPGHPSNALVADIGGTSARFARVDADGSPGRPVTIPTAAHPDLASALRWALDQMPGPPVERAALAVAGPVAGDHVALTNAAWSFSIAGLRRELGLAQLLVLNDFAALAWSLPTLRASERRRIGRAPDALARADRTDTDPPCRQALGLLGPGTGLGVSGLLPIANGQWVAVSGEGGHATLAPADEREAAIVAEVRREHPHVSIERLVSGTGLPLLHEAVGRVDGYGRDRTAAPGTTAAAAITARAQAGDAHAHATLTTFCAMLGSAAGNLALTLGARGGVHVGGGIAPRIEAFLQASPFRARFEAKGRFADYLADIPTWLIDADAPALRGAAHALDSGPAA